MDFTPTDEQQKICDIIVNKLLDYFGSPYSIAPTFLITGYAGTGKSSVLKMIKQELRNKNKDLICAMCAYTGKAASILKNKTEGLMGAFDYVGTLHKLMYVPIIEKIDGKEIIIGWEKNRGVNEDIIFVDEASMIDGQIYRDLLSYGIPIIFSGDQGQLPPVSQNSFSIFDVANTIHHFNLEKIHRQALENPIIELSMTVRKYGEIPTKIFSESVFKLNWNKGGRDIFNKIISDDPETNPDFIILCGFNETRLNINKKSRDLRMFTSDYPFSSDRVICLKNNHTSGIMNGQTGEYTFGVYKEKHLLGCTMKIDGYDGYFECLVDDRLFNSKTYEKIYDLYNNPKKTQKLARNLGYATVDFFDYAYGITVHKSQGSEWEKVILFEERSRYWDNEYYKKWLYTGVTRSKEKLFVISKV